MVHTFKCLDRNFALDVESGSVFEIDELTKDLIDLQGAPLDKTKGAFSCYSQEEIAEAQAEIQSLIDAKVLFTPEQPHNPPSYGGVVKALCLNISHNCSLRCEYCFADGGSYSTARLNMDKNVAFAAIDFLIKKSGTRRNLEVDFFGGEPLLNMDVVKDTVAYARSKEQEANKNFRFTITTNAYMLSDEDIDFFNKEMYNVVLSIDGRKEVHNCVRKTAKGEDSFDAVLSNALHFRAKRGDKQYYIRGTFTALNKDFATDALYLNDMGFDQISLEPVVLPDTHRLAIKESDVDELTKQYEILAKEYIERRKTDKWFNFFHFMIDISGGPCESKRLVGCGAGNEYLAIAPSGNIYPCHQFDGKPDYVIGNVLSGDFDDTLPKKFACANLTTKPECLKCWAKYYCSGGCAANSVNFCGDINKPYTITCALMKKRVECAIAIKAIEGK
ncbi:MAG: thioether cross-link-forming SCIFF peptide maturase [Clostridiales bacterium]|nr:thioether cross-link-forming SCIFF peptide maturase [Clostridiales bacterium]